MRAFSAFLRKELTAQKRTGKLYILAAAAVILGILAPATAKLLPKLLEAVGTEDSGMTITLGEVTAFSSFQQFFGNASMGLIAFLAVEAGILTGEYRSGTLVLALTKGLPRSKVIAAKTLTLVLIWSVFWWISFGISYGFTAFYWSMDTVNHPLFAGFAYWLFGMMMTAVILLFSSFSKGIGGVVGGLAGVYFGYSLLGMIPKLGKYLPVKLTAPDALMKGSEQIGDILPAVIITAAATAAALTAAYIIFGRRSMD